MPSTAAHSASLIVTCPACGVANRVLAEKVAQDLAPVCGGCGQELPLDGQSATGPMPVSDASFQRDVAESPIPVLLDAWAPWCGPCRAIAPTVEAIALQMQGRVRVAKLNVDENPETAERLDIRGIPTLIVFKDGREVDRLVGALPRREIVRRLETVI